ncbi:hypothetical protein K491DRAFT_710610 [Lophiostoma macrostomum CBS 122681]|uniref:Uncharacterized protein n=1 Tax=Lophiostoma macrostomum CBS 122681 TaxID=1314788 RepID=A0A6A6TRJ5_9PLEO|nr:hypothetical protein K491DRAFT_710610 [Lophiostoma macrostomum CBS 122681]
MGAGWGNAVLAGLRSLVVVVALAVIGLGAFVEYMMHDIDVRGEGLLDIVPMNEDRKEAWRAFFDALVNSQIRIWIAIAAGSFTFLAVLMVFLSYKIERFKMSRYVTIPLEFLSMLAMTAAFVGPLTLAIKMMPVCANLPTSTSRDLTTFSMVCPLTTAYTVAGGVGSFLLAITSLAALISACSQARNQKVCSFEPTASTLGMTHGYQAVIPPQSRSTIPTLYDPRKPEPGSDDKSPRGSEEVGLAVSGEEMGMAVARRDSGLSTKSGDSAGAAEISGPLGLEKPEVVAQMRPARPWSEMPKRG